ncbi:MAG TPA: hypothetical protein VH165_10870 [Kofleriaceae bacterium]|nr:hypothetical protein [Kofleriaceae bacterium]
MVAAVPVHSFDEDQHVVLRTMSWQDFEALLAIRGERSGVRMYYLDGEIEIVSPTKIRVLEKGAWVEHARTKLFPKLDLVWLTSFLEIEPQSKAVRSLRDALRTKKRRG